MAYCIKMNKELQHRYENDSYFYIMVNHFFTMLKDRVTKKDIEDALTVAQEKYELWRAKKNEN